MKQFILTYALLAVALIVQGQSDKAILHQGNKLYSQGEYQQADSLYSKVMSDQFQDLAKFNRGDALFRANELDEAIGHFNEVASTTESKELKADALHNLGNAYLSNQKLQEAVEAYKEALRLRSHDDDTRYNLAQALQMLKQQQNQDQQNQDQENQDQENQDQENQDQQNQDQQNQDQQNQDQQDQDQQNQDQQNQDQQDQDQQNQDQQKSDQQPKGSQPHQISPQDAQRMLESLNKGEKEIQLQLQKAKGKAQKKKIEKDW